MVWVIVSVLAVLGVGVLAVRMTRRWEREEQEKWKKEQEKLEKDLERLVAPRRVRHAEAMEERRSGARRPPPRSEPEPIDATTALAMGALLWSSLDTSSGDSPSAPPDPTPSPGFEGGEFGGAGASGSWSDAGSVGDSSSSYDGGSAYDGGSCDTNNSY